MAEVNLTTSGHPVVVHPGLYARARVDVARTAAPNYVVLAIVSDVLAALVASAAGFGCSWLLGEPHDHSWPTYVAVGVATALGWAGALALSGCYESGFLGIGPDEIRRILRAVLWCWAILVTLVFLVGLGPSRISLIVGLAIAGVLTAGGRLVLRQWLYAQRRRGKCLVNTLVVGSQPSIDRLTEVIDSNRVTGFRVVGSARPPQPSAGGDVRAWLDEVAEVIRANNVRAVAVAQSATVHADLLNSLAWRLDGPEIDLLLESVPGQASGPRVTYRPAPGLPLFHMDEPHLIGTRRVLKRTMDVVVSTIALLMLAPLLAAVALLVRITSRGPVFYTEYRIGQQGRQFRCSKFRTMVVGASDQREDLCDDTGLVPPAQYRDDPRITKLGRVLRRWSIDELPQLRNVIGGSMSLVGPRPIIADELPLLSDSDHRRHLTKPGLTGLWQVSGRKELHWDERMRLDLYYVEHWSPALDVVILFRTVKAVIIGHGAC